MNKQTKENRRYFILSFAAALISNQLIFQGSRLLERGRFHYDLTLPIDAAVPFLPWTIAIYIGCFVFWFFLYRLAANLPRRQADRFFGANLLCKAVCFLFFVLFPTTLSRPELNGTGFWVGCMRLLYRLDAPDNLFPSLHCVIAWLCWTGIRGNRDVPIGMRLFSLLMAVAVCLSTLTTRQHVIPDVAGGILLAEFGYFAAGRLGVDRLYGAFADRLLRGALEKRGERASDGEKTE